MPKESNFTYLALRKTLGPIIRRIWVDNVTGIENIPLESPAIIAQNHASYFDFLVFPAISPRPVYYLTDDRFFKSRLWSPLMKATNQIKIERRQKDKSHVFARIHTTLSEGKLFGIFPEGIRSKNGKLQKAYPGVIRIALENKVPIIPVGMIGTFDMLPPKKSIPTFCKCQINIGAPIVLDEFWNQEMDKSQTLELLDMLMHKIAKLSNQEYKPGLAKPSKEENTVWC